MKRRLFVWLATVMIVALSFTRSASAEPEEARSSDWGRWAPADKGMTAVDFRLGLHLTHLSIASTSVGDGRRGADYGFRQPKAYVPELAFSAFASKHLSLGIVMQVASFGSQDAPVANPESAKYTRSPMVMGVGALVEGGFSAGPILFRPGVATGPRAIMLIEDRSGKQSPPVATQWFMHIRMATEIEVTRWFAIGLGASTDALRPLDWGVFSYLSWRINDVRGSTN